MAPCASAGHSRQAAPIGGMAAVMIYQPADPYGRSRYNPLALRAMAIDKLRERLLGLMFVPDGPLSEGRQPSLDDILAGRVKGRLHDAYRQSWVASPEPDYVRVGSPNCGSRPTTGSPSTAPPHARPGPRRRNAPPGASERIGAGGRRGRPSPARPGSLTRGRRGPPRRSRGLVRAAPRAAALGQPAAPSSPGRGGRGCVWPPSPPR